MAYEEFRTKKPREEVELVASCYAKPKMFRRNFEDLPKKMQVAFIGDLSIPCEGSGVVGEWCADCVFGKVERV